MTARTPKSFANLREFYAFYLGEHGNRTCRALHFCGRRSLSRARPAQPLPRWWPIAAGILCAYALRLGRAFLLRRNSPAIFRYPCGPSVRISCVRDMLTGASRSEGAAPA